MTYKIICDAALMDGYADTGLAEATKWTADEKPVYIDKLYVVGFAGGLAVEDAIDYRGVKALVKSDGVEFVDAMENISREIDKATAIATVMAEKCSYDNIIIIADETAMQAISIAAIMYKHNYPSCDIWICSSWNECKGYINKVVAEESGDTEEESDDTEEE